MENSKMLFYDQLIAQVKDRRPLVKTAWSSRWAMAQWQENPGIAMATDGNSVPPLFADGLEALPICEAVQAMKSWNLEEASLGLAAFNAFMNTQERLEKYDCYLPFEQHYTAGMDFRGKTVGIVGHMHGPQNLRAEAKTVYVLERNPRPGDFPDSACEFLLPRCDIVLITGSSIINKTLPRLVELSRNAYTVLTGPSVPLCPSLLNWGIDRIAGLVLTDREGMAQAVAENLPGSPMIYGKPFMLCR